MRDLVWDYAPYEPKLFRVTEIIGLIQIALLATTVIFHKHRLVILRRICIIVGTLYLVRSLTTVVTSLTIPGMHVTCQEKYPSDLPITEVFKKILQVLVGGGMQISGVATGCGGYLFSGHTVVLLTTCLFIKQYLEPLFREKHYSYVYQIIRYSLNFMSAFGMICVVLSHEHYTVDVICAYYVTTRIFWIYHSIVQLPELRKIITNKEKKDKTLFEKILWVKLLKVAEENVHVIGF